MLSYVKYIVLGFGLIMLGLIGFFGFQNKEDLQLWFSLKNKIEKLPTQNCLEKYRSHHDHFIIVQKDHPYFCIREHFVDHFQDSSLTGISLGLKTFFSWAEEYEPNDLHLKTLMFLDINTQAVQYSFKNFRGPQVLYGAYLRSLKDFIDSAKIFHDNLIKGLLNDDKQGLEVLRTQNSLLYEEYKKSTLKLDKMFDQYYNEVIQFQASEADRLLKKAKGQS